MKQKDKDTIKKADKLLQNYLDKTGLTKEELQHKVYKDNPGISFDYQYLYPQQVYNISPDNHIKVILNKILLCKNDN